jgi:hypothetical protein
MTEQERRFEQLRQVGFKRVEQWHNFKEREQKGLLAAIADDPRTTVLE